MTKFLGSYGTYVSILLVIITAGLQAYGVVIPEWTYTLEGAMGLTAFRSTVSVQGAGPGWKSYAVAAIGGLIAGAQAYGLPVPDWATVALAAAGFGSLHVAVQKV